MMSFWCITLWWEALDHLTSRAWAVPASIKYANTVEALATLLAVRRTDAFPFLFFFLFGP